jgi:hypothetical protein
VFPFKLFNPLELPYLRVAAVLVGRAAFRCDLRHCMMCELQARLNPPAVAGPPHERSLIAQNLWRL